MLTEEELEVFCRIARAQERIADHFDEEDQRLELERAELEKQRAESWERVRSQPITVEPIHSRLEDRPPCIFCDARAARVTRGPLILGCVVCFSKAIAP